MENSSMTALMSCFARAYHAERDPNPIFNDSVARKLLTDEEYATFQRYVADGLSFFDSAVSSGAGASYSDILLRVVNDNLAATPVCRAAFAEKALATATLSGNEQYVLLGAGMDTFAYRNPEYVAKHMVYEVDCEATQADKLYRLGRGGICAEPNVRYVSCDFTKDSIAEKLLAAGFDKSKKTFFCWMGVSYYLAWKDIYNFWSQLAEICADGSTLCFDYPDRELFGSTDKRAANMVKMAAASGEPIKSCFDEMTLTMLLADNGFLLYELLTPDDIKQQIVTPAGNSTLTPFPHVNYALAVYKN